MPAALPSVIPRPHSPAGFGYRAVRAVVFCVLFACKATFLFASPTNNKVDIDTPTRVETALQEGEILLADSLLKKETRWKNDAQSRHRREILGARLAATRGDWKSAEARLLAWEQSSARRTGSGEILFWRGWAALHQGRLAEGDSLFVLSSAYVEGEDALRAQDALEYRFAALLENSPALQDYVRGLPESPLPGAMRANSLKQVPAESKLHPQALWQLALLTEFSGDSAQSHAILMDLAQDRSTLPGRRAAAVLAFLREKSNTDSALNAYEALLIKNQQGAIAEFSRQRVQALRRLGNGGSSGNP